jgi:hypothetical protein
VCGLFYVFKLQPFIAYSVLKGILISCKVFSQFWQFSGVPLFLCCEFLEAYSAHKTSIETK